MKREESESFDDYRKRLIEEAAILRHRNRFGYRFYDSKRHGEIKKVYKGKYIPKKLMEIES